MGICFLFCSTCCAHPSPPDVHLPSVAGPCRDCPSIDKRPPADASPFAPPRLERLDWGEVAGAIALQPGAKLRLVNLHLSNFAYKSQYQYSPTTPYFSVGVGMSIWPTVNLAPNSTCMGLNISGTYVNPSDTDDCPRYVQKSLSYLMQVWPSLWHGCQ